jgi:hypothetical protein
MSAVDEEEAEFVFLLHRNAPGCCGLTFLKKPGFRCAPAATHHASTLALAGCHIMHPTCLCADNFASMLTVSSKWMSIGSCGTNNFFQSQKPGSDPRKMEWAHHH